MDSTIIINNKKYIYDDNKDKLSVKHGIVYINDKIAIEVEEGEN